MIRSVFAGSLLGLALLAQPADAQARRATYERIPPGHVPPAGMCRAWLDGVPAGRQPRPTDCRTAYAQANRYGGVVIRGDDYDRNGKAKGKHKAKKHDRYDDRYGRRDRDDDRYDRDRRDRDDERYGGRERDRYCVDANRDGTCDVSQGRTGERTRNGSTAGTIPGTTYPRGSTTPATRDRQTVRERMEEIRREQERRSQR